MKITTILPVSRINYLDRVIESLLNQTYKSQRLIVIFDGSNNDFITVRNRIVGLDFESVLCVKSNSDKPALTIPDRRKRIAHIHNQFRDLIGDADWVFAIEDDGILPHDALRSLVRHVSSHNDTGMVTGVELGRWGAPYVGAWLVDNVYDTTDVTSLRSKANDNTATIDEIDACGLYCALIRADRYKSHEFFAYNGLGPDINLGLYLRQQGFRNYIDWRVLLTHITTIDNIEYEIEARDISIVIGMTSVGNDNWHIGRLRERE